MNRVPLSSRLFICTLRHHRSSSTTTNQPTPLSPPSSKEMTKKQPVFDQVTHTGQAWDEKDYRMQRFTISPKQVNPNIAMSLVAEDRPTPSHDRVVFCDGGHPALGHPRVYINLDKPGNHICQYCGHRFVNTHVTTDNWNKDIVHV